MNPVSSIIAALFILVIVFFAVRSLVIKRRRGDCGCGCENCSGCGMKKGGPVNHPAERPAARAEKAGKPDR